MSSTHPPFSKHSAVQSLVSQAAPWRPIDDEGVLIAAQRAPRTKSVLHAECGQMLLRHMQAVCLWPARQKGESWNIGDYSFYILEFQKAKDVSVYAQVWSEPLEEVIFEVSSGEWTPPAERTLDAGQREILRDHGFETGKDAERNFRKAVGAKTARDVRALSREMLAVLCTALGYEGRQRLSYRLHLGTRASVRPVFGDLCASDLLKFLREWGFPAELVEEQGKPLLIMSSAQGWPFVITFFGDENARRSGEYGVLGLRAVAMAKDADPHQLANEVNKHTILAQASVRSEGHVTIETQILLHGGITAENLKLQFEQWRSSLQTAARVVA